MEERLGHFRDWKSFNCHGSLFSICSDNDGLTCLFFAQIENGLIERITDSLCTQELTIWNKRAGKLKRKHVDRFIRRPREIRVAPADG